VLVVTFAEASILLAPTFCEGSNDEVKKCSRLCDPIAGQRCDGFI
jgi:hypothetical protein